MNILKGKIVAIESNNSLSLVTVSVKDVHFKIIVIETPETVSYLKLESSISVIFKETEVIIEKGKESVISISNKIKGEISKIEEGSLLSKVMLKTHIGEINAILISEHINRMQLKIGEQVTALIKTSEIMLTQ